MAISASQAKGSSPVSLLLPYGGWVVALALGIWIAKAVFGTFFQELGRRFATRFLSMFGGQALGRRGLTRYRKSIAQNYGQHALGFQAGGTVNVRQVYVPLQYLDDNEQRRDLWEAMTHESRVVILGEPGAGKSLLMKHILMSWAEGDPKTLPRIPILVELHRCNAEGMSIIRLIQDEFERNGIRGKDGFVDAALRGGILHVLLDGLDEVSRESQTRVVTEIKDFVAKYNECNYVASCRIAVYTSQLQPGFLRSILISDFDDAGIRTLLAKWPDLDVEEADRLFAELAENPNLMRLAGSPLILTMMVYLHTQVYARSGRRLPGSRQAFYNMAVDHLLSRDTQLARDLSVYESSNKRAALQRIALTLQQSPTDQADRRSIAGPELQGTVKQIAANLNLRDSDVPLFITEIVERSQLLVKLNGYPPLYVFRHLTLQEFLAAFELRNSPQELMSYYRADRVSWRETVRLWCGVTDLDCTSVVKEILRGDDHEALLALQCAGEATNISSVFANEVVGHFLNLIVAGESSHSVETALGAVAADDRPRGRELFEQLRDLFLADGPGHDAAARAIAASRRPAAAAVLGERVGADKSARTALRSMGEQAIPVLRAAAESSDDLTAVDDLGEIGTASAAGALLTMLWDDSPRAYRAAWWIAALISRNEVQDGLETARPVEPRGELLDWLWRPFSSSLPKLAEPLGRVALLIARDVSDRAPYEHFRVDPRLGLPLVTLNCSEIGDHSVFANSLARSFDVVGYRDALDNIESTFSESEHFKRNLLSRTREDVVSMCLRADPAIGEPLISSVLSASGVAKHLHKVFFSLPLDIQTMLLPSYDRWCYSTSRQWVESTEDVKAPNVLEATLKSVLTLASIAVVGLVAYYSVGSLFGVTISGPLWLNTIDKIALIILTLALIVWFFSEVLGMSDRQWLRFVIDITDEVIDSEIALVVAGISALVCVGTFPIVLHRLLSWLAIIGIIGLTLIVVGVLTLLVSKRNSRRQNPFRRLVALLSIEEGDTRYRPSGVYRTKATSSFPFARS